MNEDDMGISEKQDVNDIARYERIVERDNNILGLYERWIIDVCSNNYSISFLKRNGFNNVAIYGYGSIGRALVKVLKSHNIGIAYIIESNELRWESEYIFYRPADDLPRADVILVSAINDYQDIKEGLIGRISCPIISLDDMIP